MRLQSLFSGGKESTRVWNSPCFGLRIGNGSPSFQKKYMNVNHSTHAKRSFCLCTNGEEKKNHSILKMFFLQGFFHLAKLLHLSKGCFENKWPRQVSTAKATASSMHLFTSYRMSYKRSPFVRANAATHRFGFSHDEGCTMNRGSLSCVSVWPWMRILRTSPSCENYVFNTPNLHT